MASKIRAGAGPHSGLFCDLCHVEDLGGLDAIKRSGRRAASVVGLTQDDPQRRRGAADAGKWSARPGTCDSLRDTAGRRPGGSVESFGIGNTEPN